MPKKKFDLSKEVRRLARMRVGQLQPVKAFKVKKKKGKRNAEDCEND
jgi:hypothetical protein